jgi:hypothetical protein
LIVFPDQPDTDPYEDDTALNNTMYVLRSDFLYTTLANFNIVVPAGFKTDEMSIPESQWSIFGICPDGYYRAAGVVHDFLYDTAGDSGVYTRSACDGILLEILTRSGMGWFKRKAVYLAVRLFGGSHWKGK